MSNFAYYLLWLVAGLVIIAITSAVVARQLRARLVRRLQAAQLLDALRRYSEWIAGQRRAMFFHGDAQEDSCLQEVRAIAQQWFPELGGEAAQIFAVHARVIDFLWAQQLLRQSDPEAWLECDHDAQFMDLWRQHLGAVHAVVAKLEAVAGAADMRPGPGTASPA